MSTIDMKKIYNNKSYRGNWVALRSFTSDPEVIAYAKTLKETLKKADKKGFQHPVIMQIPKEILPIIGII
ncbi:hypothetical protein A3D83_03255 [Candidatus Daviesbacteria bacterium RIFCSPHIGHO2_02_FULL_41_10]|uniref:DUF5678 domain-containing protein n=2 Tax=Candidatus Daviesiibacteriota TaxID=1752718 RepID=A0A1F5IQC5_9BACT|nr:MAG: hypothetical protein A2871_03720 [Candidatus Daviesbacteria bacterium RIFCSPHIGHO2_01_FULL_41_23]OGE32566.1 MAG: hypothetical protein A3D83_03255 [Candidatus Daviesbacteria bacterium RIFCSPHIGHO2_02_FULL_41_10]OGE62351.1 MAG: hypothetical protein A2967_02755 [Candidatus Daviesbacteria bacterium RIFCSPLOWO2_01_FULL_41_32]